MSVYFLSAHAGKIQALTGIKSIVIPAEELHERFRRFAARENGAEGSAAAELESLLTGQGIDERGRAEKREIALSEELDHFRCLVHSRVATAFSLWNVLLRLVFSTIWRRGLESLDLSPRLVDEEALRYWHKYALFHYVAAPWLEARYQALAPCIDSGFPLHERRVTDCLGAFPEGKPPSHAAIGALVDRNFRSMQDGGSRLLARTEFEEAPLPGDRFAGALVLASAARCLLFPQAWRLIAGVAIRNWPVVAGFGRSRFRRSGLDNAGFGTLPGILSGDLTIDPAAFALGKKALASQEVKFDRPEHKVWCDLLWHILSRLAVNKTLLDCGLSQRDLFLYYNSLRRFSRAWSPRASEASVIMADLDNRLVDEAAIAPGVSILDSRHIVIRALHQRAFNVFREFSKEEEVRFPSIGLAHALNCTYMHI